MSYRVGVLVPVLGFMCAAAMSTNVVSSIGEFLQAKNFFVSGFMDVSLYCVGVIAMLIIVVRSLADLIEAMGWEGRGGGRACMYLDVVQSCALRGAWSVLHVVFLGFFLSGAGHCPVVA